MHRRHLKYGLLALGAVAFVCILQLACGDPSHIFQGRFFVNDRACLGTTSSVDVVEGDLPASECAAACLVQPLSDGGRSVYVSTMCPPYPYSFDAGGGDLECPPALAAFTRDDTCLSDGGSSHPLDSGADADADTDANADPDADADAGELDAASALDADAADAG